MQNAPSARIIGVEIELRLAGDRALTLSGDGAYNHAELTNNFCGADPVTGIVDRQLRRRDAQAVNGQQLPYTPSSRAT